MVSKSLSCIVVLIALGAGLLLYTSDTKYIRLVGTKDTPGLLDMIMPNSVQGDNLNSEVNDYEGKWHETAGQRDPSMVDNFYNMVTDFYEYGWGKSFHFAHTYKNESHDDSIRRHEEYLSDKIQHGPGLTALDVGSGVGGPARAIAKHSGGHVVGVTINKYQVAKSTAYNKEQGLDHLVKIVQGDFTKLDFPDNTFDRAFAVEATCHSPKLIDVYKEVYRTLKPGGLFGSYEWLTTFRYDANNETQRKVINGIEFGNALPPLRSHQGVLDTAAELGFEVVFEEDLAEDEHNTRPWYHRLEMSWLSQKGTHLFCQFMEAVGLAAKGTVQVHEVLLTAADNLVLGGQQKTFTPMHLFIFRKPSTVVA